MRKLTLLLLLLTGINALIAGILFIIDPSGSAMGMTTDYLQPSPFHSFRIPGLVLFTCIGIGCCFALFATFKKRPNAGLLIRIQGILLTGWILVQMLMVRDINPLHVVMGSIGIFLFFAGSFTRSPSR